MEAVHSQARRLTSKQMVHTRPEQLHVRYGHDDQRGRQPEFRSGVVLPSNYTFTGPIFDEGTLQVDGSVASSAISFSDSGRPS